MLSMAAVVALGVPTPAVTPSSPLVLAQSERRDRAEQDVDLKPQVIEESPVLQRWLEEVPDLDADIRHDPAIRPRLRVGYSHPLSQDDHSEAWIGIEDAFIESTQLSVSGEYRASLEDETNLSYGGELRYYLRSLGSRVNVAPVAGYRFLDTGEDEVSGPSVGVRMVLALSRNGAGDIALSQTWINPGSSEELGVTALSSGYAVTSNVRVGTELQIRNSAQTTQHHIGVGLEWMF